MTGIVAEYNPFHSGHRYHVKASDDGCVVAVLSGDYVQRGEPAIADKFTRAKLACLNGVNLVVELPLPWSLSSAEHFAFGAVSLLQSLHVDRISFGSECGDLEELKKASAIDEAAVSQCLRQHRDYTYPRARREVSGSSLLDFPNNLLGMEYMRFASVPCMTVKRSGEHDGARSAMELRQKLRAKRIGFDYERFDLAAVSRLRMLEEESFIDLPDSSHGLGQRLYQAVRTCGTLDEICMAAKTKSTTLSAVRRLAMCAVLGIRAEDLQGSPPYLRVLAFDEKGKEVLHRGADLPVITNGRQVADLKDKGKRIFSLGSSAHDLYALCSPALANTPCGEDYRAIPYKRKSRQDSDNTGTLSRL